MYDKIIEMRRFFNITHGLIEKLVLGENKHTVENSFFSEEGLHKFESQPSVMKTKGCKVGGGRGC